MSDTFRRVVYWHEPSDTFYIIDYSAKARPQASVVTQHINDKDLWMERYHGQAYIGVALKLQKYVFQKAIQCALVMILAVLN